ncbi:MAG: caspase family protein [Saprospiraceae bacterium]|nr:caspase family protein [Saprospiraceae bacterium]
MAENRSVGGLPNSPLEHLKKGKNYLFAIGINKYQHFTPLSNARKDIEDLAPILKEIINSNSRTFFWMKKLRELISSTTLNDLPEKVAPEDKLIIYYSGHGKSKRMIIEKLDIGSL